MAPRKSDLKRAVAVIALGKFKDGVSLFPANPFSPEYTIVHSDDFQATIRVEGQDGAGPRYFTILVKEQM
jgi:hypothetical protein